MKTEEDREPIFVIISTTGHQYFRRGHMDVRLDTNEVVVLVSR